MNTNLARGVSPRATTRAGAAAVPASLLLAILITGCSWLPQQPAPETSVLKKPTAGAEPASRVPAPGNSSRSAPVVVATEDKESRDAKDFQRSRLVAADLVGALAQLRELPPASTRLYAKPPTSKFGELLLANLQRVGYDMRVGDATSTPQFDYTIETGPNDKKYTFLVSAASIKLKRQYLIDDSGVEPLTSMFVLGADATQITLEDEIFVAAEPVDKKRVSGQRRAVAKVVSPKPTAALTLSVAAKPPQATRLTPQQQRAMSQTPKPGNDQLRKVAAARQTATAIAPPKTTTTTGIKQNVFLLRQSNYSGLLSDYDTVRKEVLVFPNDSLVMGRLNKNIARDISDNFNPVTDLISVIGCSHGKSAIENGNEVLAIGRSFRVKEEFLLAGIASEKVLDEGCWDGKAFDDMPARGVVVSLRRRAG